MVGIGTDRPADVTLFSFLTIVRSVATHPARSSRAYSTARSSGIARPSCQAPSKAVSSAMAARARSDPTIAPHTISRWQWTSDLLANSRSSTPDSRCLCGPFQGESGVGKTLERPRDSSPVIQRPSDRQAFLAERSRRHTVSLLGRHEREVVEHGCNAFAIAQLP